MADVDDAEIVTEFLLSTYRLQPTLHDVRAVLESAGVTNFPPKDEPEVDWISLITGSSAELYIKPMLPCVDDIDIMHHRNTKLAIPTGYPAPTRLPDEFHSRVMVYEIIDSEYPGYVYLGTRYVLTENNDDGRYNATIVHWPWPLNIFGLIRPDSATNVIHGPANTCDIGVNGLLVDRVDCMRCLSWPSQAADWPTRRRKYGWPDSATVARVVSNGSDVVFAAHRLCRHDQWKSMTQYRLSLSRAEIVLLNSWVPVRQIVYHMLRVFMKTERLTDVTDNTGTKIISNYHIKTLMLWACEMKPRNWWLKRNAVIICVELLRVLTIWLTDSRCKHYFISNCNLMDTVMNQERIVAHLTSATEPWLSTWFVNNYIRKCAQRCPDHIKRLFDDVSTRVRLRNAVSSVVQWRRITPLREMPEMWGQAQYLILWHALRWSQRVHAYVYFVETITKLDVLHTDYLTAVALLHIAIKFTNHDDDIELMDVLSTLCGQSVGRRRYSSQRNSVMLLRQATKLMKVVAYDSRSTVQLLEIELSKAYLYRALRCRVSNSNSVYCLASVYLAVMYYNTGQYRTAIDYCTLVVRSQDHSQCTSHVVQGELLPNIDAGVDNVLGLDVFYQHVRTVALNHKLSQHVSVFSTKLFAHYMLMSCLSATECHQLARAVSMNEVQRCYWKDVGDRQQLFIDDLLLFKTLSFSSKFRHYFQHHRQRPTINTADMNTAKLVELLQQSAVEHLTTFRQFEARELSFIRHHVTTDFEAMYSYKRGEYQLCLLLSTQNVRTLLKPGRLADVFTFPELIQLLDGDIVSLTALTLIVDPECRTWSLNVGITQLTLSLYLMTQCQLKLRHSATLLAQTLDYIQAAHRRHPADAVLDLLTLKLTKRKIMLHLRHNFK